MPMSEYILYILKSQKTGRYYVGITADLGDRLRRHNSGQNISTRPGRPWQLVYIEKYPDRGSAWAREKQLKRYKGGEAFKNLIN